MLLTLIVSGIAKGGVPGLSRVDRRRILWDNAAKPRRLA